MSDAPAPVHWRLGAARATAWALLLAGWGGLGAFAQLLAASEGWALGLVAVWLLALGLMATVATRDTLRATSRRAAVVAAGALVALALPWAARGGGIAALLVALAGWAALAALASGVVRSLRWAQPGPPGPPVVAAGLGAGVAALALGDLSDVAALVPRLIGFVAAAALLLAVLQPADAARARPSRCRAGLFDCSLPAWPAGAWSELQGWPTLLAGLVMLPTMAALPWMARLCRATAVPPEAMVLLHFGAMFVPAMLLRYAVGAVAPRTLAGLCAACLAAGAACALWAPPPFDLAGVALAQGVAWGLAWAGQLWAPERRGAAGASPLRAAAGYAVLTVMIGLLLERAGAQGLAALHVLIGLVAAAAWLAAGAWRAGRADPAGPPRTAPPR